MKYTWRNMASFLTLTLMLLFLPVLAEAGIVTDRFPLQMYAESQLNTYNNIGDARRAGWADGGTDLIRVTSINNGWLRVSHPGSGGRTVNRWCKANELFVDPGYSNRGVNVRGAQTVYRTSTSGTKFGSVSNNESVVVLAERNNRAQILYRLDNGTGYKVGWVAASAVQKNTEPERKQTSESPNPPTSHNPVGYFDSVVSNNNNQITIRGWAADRDDMGKSLKIHVYVGGPAGSGAESCEITANKSRPDVQRHFANQGVPAGEYYGFYETIKVTQRTGNQPVYVYAINVGGGSNVEIGHKSVDIKSSAIGGKEKDGWIKTNGANVNFRLGPSTGTVSLGKIANGTQLKVLEHNNPNGWSKIKYNGREGYVASQYVTLEKSAGLVLNVMPLKQNDSRWKSKKIGSKTIGAIGCTVTSITMKYNYHNDTNLTPADMLKKLKFSNNDIIWGSVRNLGYTVYTVSNKPALDNSWMSRIYTQLKNGKPVILGAYQASGQHWVVVKGYNGNSTSSFNANNFSINDPMNNFTNLQQFIKKYNKGLRGMIY